MFMTELAQHYLTTVTATFRAQKKLADEAIAQLEEGAFFATLDPLSNPIAVIVKHMAGNLRSRWRDFLTSDGEKPDRHREGEFVLASEGMAELLQEWEAGWQTLFDTLETLAPDDLLREVTIRGRACTAVEALERSLAHAAQHTGQIVLLAKHWRGDAWQTLSIPRGGSVA